MDKYEERALALGLRPLGVIVVLGIAQVEHALLQVFIFYFLFLFFIFYFYSSVRMIVVLGIAQVEND